MINIKASKPTEEVPKIVVPKKKKHAVKHRIKKTKRRREVAILKDRIQVAEMEVAKSIMHLKYHEIQLAKHTRDPKYTVLADEYRDAKDTYERLMARIAFPHKKKVG